MRIEFEGKVRWLSVEILFQLFQLFQGFFLVWFFRDIVGKVYQLRVRMEKEVLTVLRVKHVEK